MSQSELACADRLISEALREDLQNSLDVTTDTLVPVEATGAIQVVSREAGILSGNEIAKRVFEIFDERVQYSFKLQDGDQLQVGSLVAEISGPMRSILTAERTALNFLTMLSGVATLTGKYIARVQGTSAKILDTRKTLPGLREVQKYAVRCGGGTNHRMGLFDAVLVKDNHLAWWKNRSGKSSLGAVIEEIRRSVPGEMIVEIEVDSLTQFHEVIEAKPDIILLDNMTNEALTHAVKHRNEHGSPVQLEASGGVRLDTVAAIAETGVDRISVGALTHSAVALDLGFDWNSTT